VLTLIDAISLAGDRLKQNDDACGWRPGQAWVIDGATDLHDAPLSKTASDASWIAQIANGWFGAADIAAGEAEMRQAARDASLDARAAFLKISAWPQQDWAAPIASLLLVRENQNGVIGLDLGDCRAFALGADEVAASIGGPPGAADDETQYAAKAAQEAGETPLLRHEATLDLLRAGRSKQNGGGGNWTFCLKPECAQEARVWTLNLERPAHLLLASDGFAALVDRYRLFDAQSLIESALSEGLAELGVRLRAYENDDSGGAKHPRWKKSDDATALLLRLD
jgi:hypothetical protein